MNILDFAMPAALMSQPISRQDWLDGYAIPRGKTTLFAVPQGSGKTTSVMTAMVELSTIGSISLLGQRDYGAPQRCILVSGEETYDDIRRKLDADHPQLRSRIEGAVAAGNLLFVCLKELRERNAITGPMFDEKGHPTDDWRKIAGAIKAHEPAFVFIDTLNSVSACEYMDSQSPYVTIPALDALAKATGAAVMISTHTSKEGMKGEIDEKTPANTLLASMRGSGQLSAAARCVIVMAEASSRAFSTLEVEDGDAKYAMILKTSLSHPDVMRVLPVIRSRKRKTYIATTQGDGENVVSLHAAVRDGAERIYAQLEVILTRLIRAASATRSPFSETGKYAIPSLVTSTLAGLLPAGAEAHHIEHVLDALEGIGVIEKSRGSRAGSMIYDIRDGMFATDHDPATGKPPVIRKGAPIREMLIEVVGAGSEQEVTAIIEHYVERLSEGPAQPAPAAPGADTDDHAAPARDHAPPQPAAPAAAPAAPDEHAHVEGMATELGEDDLAAIQADHAMVTEAPAMVTHAAEAAAPATADDNLEDLPF